MGSDDADAGTSSGHCRRGREQIASMRANEAFNARQGGFEITRGSAEKSVLSGGLAGKLKTYPLVTQLLGAPRQFLRLSCATARGKPTAVSAPICRNTSPHTRPPGYELSRETMSEIADSKTRSPSQSALNRKTLLRQRFSLLAFRKTP